MKKEYNKLSKYYDMLHNEKDYKSECDYFSNVIFKNKESKKNNLLDLACGTWEHIKFLKKDFDCEWLDSSEEMIDIAKKKNPWINFYVGDMTSFKLDKKYDVITILFNSIWYLNEKELESTIKNAYNHLNKWGIFLIETAFIKNRFNATKNTRIYNDWNLNIIRNISIKHYKNSVIVKAQYKINSSIVIEEDEQKVILFEENEIKNLLKLENFKVKIYHYKNNNSTIFIATKK